MRLRCGRQALRVRFQGCRKGGCWSGTFRLASIESAEGCRIALTSPSWLRGDDKTSHVFRTWEMALAAVPGCALEAKALERSLPAPCCHFDHREPCTRSLCKSGQIHRQQPDRHYCLQQPHSPPSQPCDDINPLMPPILTGYALHITELDVESRTHFDKGTPSNFGRFAVIRLDHGNTRQSGNSLRRRVLSSHVSSSVQDAGIFYR